MGIGQHPGELRQTLVSICYLIVGERHKGRVGEWSLVWL